MSDSTNQASEFILDPEGEVTIILHNPNAPLAVWDLTSASTHYGAVNSTKVDWTSKAATGATRNSVRAQAMALARRMAEPDEATAQVSSEANLFENEAEDGHDPEKPGEDASGDAPGDNEKKASDEESSTPKPAAVRFRASAKHLMLASPVFQSMLIRNGWKEATQLKEQGSVDINAYDFGTEALLVFLRIVHCQVTQIPDRMSLDLMAKLAVVADYYKCRDLVAFYVKRIIRDSHCNTQPKRFSRTLVLWIWVSYFYEIDYLFDLVTTTAVREAGGVIAPLGLPIPREIIDDLNDIRVKGIKKVVDALHAAKDALLTPPVKCSIQCDSALLGALTMQMQVHGLLSPKPQEPFVGLRYRSLVKDVDNFWCPDAWDVKHTIHYWMSIKPERRFTREYKKINCHLRRIQRPTFDSYLPRRRWLISGSPLASYLRYCPS